MDIAGYLGVSGELTGILAVLGSAAGIAGALGVAWPILRSKTLTTTNELLAQSLEVTRNEFHELEKRCAAETAELRGRLQVLTDGFAQSIATAVATATVDELVKAGAIPDRRQG